MTLLDRLPEKPKGQVPCWYCGQILSRAKTFDHVQPLCKGGINIAANIVVACGTCNNELKNCRTLEEFRAFMVLWLNYKAAKRHAFVVIKNYRFFGERNPYPKFEFSFPQNLPLTTAKVGV